MQTKRSQKFVDSSVQGALLRRIFTHWCSFFAIAAIVAVSMQALVGDPAQSFSDRLVAEAKSFTLIGLVMLSLLPAFMLDTIRFSNRFVGPVGRLRQSLASLKNLNTKHITFRDNDYWIVMADEFNAVADLIESQRKEIEELKKESKEVSSV